MEADLLLAHGGAVGAAFEAGFILVPVVVFAILARISKKRMEREQAAEEGPDVVDDGP